MNPKHRAHVGPDGNCPDTKYSLDQSGTWNRELAEQGPGGRGMPSSGHLPTEIDL